MNDLAATGDGRVLDPTAVADHLAIQDLVVAYAHAVDDRDWQRWEGLFLPTPSSTTRRQAASPALPPSSPPGCPMPCRPSSSA